MGISDHDLFDAPPALPPGKVENESAPATPPVDDSPSDGAERRVEAIRRGLARRWPDTTCPECGDCNWVNVYDPDWPGYSFVRPCSICSPVPYQRWAAGRSLPEILAKGEPA